ncbi:SGNH/GDSL hydrolase family protein [Williamsia sterculiae]|uniref:GDSL-like Lipase/Acylhydrolase family protein n=1 Tax=Williamsia sterculiae TaxID=1344003 RepID=A0A1N7EYK1_9NOCA|nr:SGNH/GDSL hydrolase family protein [Williamsia sterculiae]SIR93169.1 GDSL-like Lipase/Acylhydrolase family protein [Williamsia sterculiae]
MASAIAVALVVALVVVLAYPHSVAPVDTADVAHDESVLDVVKPLHYVALGSSYAAGADTADVVDLRCLRTGDNYPHLLARALGLSLTDVTCSGSTIADILNRSHHRHALPPQIDAVTATTDVVTITTGGNDVGYIGRLTGISCANRVTSSDTVDGLQCAVGHPRRPPAAEEYELLRERLVDVVDAVRARAPRALVVFVDYPPVLDANGDLCPAVPLTPDEAFSTVRTYDGLTFATRSAAATSGSLLVDVAGPGTEHTACSPSPWVNGYRLPVPYHPNLEGRDAMAALTRDAIGAAGLLQRR